MGHRNTQQIESATRDYNNAVSEFSDGASAVFQCILEFLEKTYKDTSMIIEKHEDFFNSIYVNDTEGVVVIDSSLSNINRPYFERIRDEEGMKEVLNGPSITTIQKILLFQKKKELKR